MLRDSESSWRSLESFALLSGQVAGCGEQRDNGFQVTSVSPWRQNMNYLSLFAAIALAFWSGPVRLQAREYKTLAVLSGASVETVVGDLEFLGKTIQNPRLAENAGKALIRHSRIASLEGLDPSRRC